ncbi:RAB3A interacting protein [Coemansia sp. RSA 2681]|nr:RAB3A interacting protein [Coemansia sp. RSA 2681]
MCAAFHEASIKRQGIIIPGEYDQTATAKSLVKEPAPADDWHLATPTDSSPTSTATVRSASEDGVSSGLSLVSPGTATKVKPTLARRRAPFKIASAMNYCPDGGAPSKEAAGGNSSSGGGVRLRKTRSQSPQPPSSSSDSVLLASPQMHANDLLQLLPPPPQSATSPVGTSKPLLFFPEPVEALSDEGHRSTIFMVAATDENSNWVKSLADLPASASEPAPAPPSPPSVPEQSDRRRSNSSSTVSALGLDQAAHYEALMLRAQGQRNEAMAEANTLQQQMDALQRASGSEIAQLRAELEAASRKLRIEYELRTAAETKCALMECELAELSSNIQYEAQNLVAVERREHRAEADRMARSHAEVLQLMEMERAQVASLKQSLETVNVALDRERAEVDRLRSGMVAFERQVGALIAPTSSAPISPVGGAPDMLLPPSMSGRSFSASVISNSSGRLARSTPQSLDCVMMGSAVEPHIVGSLYFGNDATRPDTRLAEFLGFINVSSDKEAHNCAFMQRSMREDVGPTLVADSSGSGMTSLSAWSKGRRLVHGVQENTLILESFSPRVQLSRVMSLGCYLCGCSISRPQSSASLVSMPLSPPPSSASSSDQQRMQSLGGSSIGRAEMYRMRFNDNDEDNKPLCHHCHGRMVAVCSFFAYLKIVRKGLIKRPIADIWLEVNKARLQMWLARSGASPDSRVAIST